MEVVGGHLVMLFKVEDNVYLAVVVVVVLLLYITACVSQARKWREI